MKASEGLIRQVHDLAAELVQAVASAESLRSLAIAQIEARRRVAVDEMRQKHDRAIAQVMDELRHITEQCGLSAAAWDDPIWMRFTTWPDITPSPVTRVGTLTIEGSTTSICTPALVPIVGGRNLIIKAKGGAKQEAARALQSVVLRLLATVPPAKLRILFIDPVGLGQNAADFMELADYVEELVGGMAQSEPTRIGHELADLSDHMAMVIQKYLRGRYQSIEEYNAEAGEVAEPYRLHRRVGPSSGEHCGERSAVRGLRAGHDRRGPAASLWIQSC
jgi:S-DNA-T family DNA segregation ATPase FtsK/SpoIIIE